MLLKIALILLLIFLFYQDIKYRAVYWLLFPAILILQFFMAIQYHNLTQFFSNGLYNIVFLCSQFLLLTVYFSIKNKKNIFITTHYLGWADVLFLIVTGFSFSPLNYLLFYISSLFIILLLALGISFKNQNQKFKIPLAGLQAVFFIIFLMMDWGSQNINLFDDSLLVNLINKWMY